MTLWQRIRANMLAFAIVTSIIEVLGLLAVVFIAFPQAGMPSIWTVLALLAVAFPMSIVIWTRYYKTKHQ
jgi:hypothetical protein